MQWAPPSALRRIDLILVDEASQYDDREGMRFIQSVKEQPHLPYVVAVADFQQLQPVASGGHCQKMLEAWPRVDLDTVYRTSDADQLLFLNRVRERQPLQDRGWWPCSGQGTKTLSGGRATGWFCVVCGAEWTRCLGSIFLGMQIGDSEEQKAFWLTTQPESHIWARLEKMKIVKACKLAGGLADL